MTVLFGETLSRFDSYRKSGESSAYHTNTEKTLRWLLFLLAGLDDGCGRFTTGRFPNPPGQIRTRQHCTSHLVDQYVLLDWCFETLQPEAKLRTSASALRMRASAFGTSLMCACRTLRPREHMETDLKTLLRIPNIDKSDALNFAFPVSWEAFNRLYWSG